MLSDKCFEALYSKKIVSNYRPISVLPAFSKITERLVYNRLIEFLNKYNILSTSQYGFRKKFSTTLGSNRQIK